MFDEYKTSQMYNMFKRIFSFSITRSTYREVQNALMGFSDRNEETLKALMESFFGGVVNPALASKCKGDSLQKLIDEFGMQVRLSREVHDRGEFVSFLTSDVLSQAGNKVLFANTVRRVDNEEFRFISDVESTLQIVNHFISRLQEAKRMEAGQGSLNSVKDEIFEIKSKIEELIR